MHKMYVPTAIGLALLNAAKKVDHQAPADQTWVARRVEYNAEHTSKGVRKIVTNNAHLKMGTYKKLHAQGVL